MDWEASGDLENSEDWEVSEVVLAGVPDSADMAAELAVDMAGEMAGGAVV